MDQYENCVTDFCVGSKYQISFNFICIFRSEACRQMYCIGVVITVVLQDFAYISIVKKFPVALWSIYSKQSLKFCTRKESMHYLCPEFVST